MLRAPAPVLAVLLTLSLPTRADAPGTVEIAGTSPLPAGCSQQQPQAEDEPHVAARGDALTAVWVQGGGAGLAWSASANGGRTWSASRALAGWTSCTGGPGEYVINPRVAVGRGGSEWVIATSMSGAAEVRVAARSDRAQVWSAPTTVASGVIDFPALAVLGQRSALVAYADRAVDRVVVTRSDDLGRTWTGGSIVHFSSPGTASFPLLAGRPDGVAVLVVDETPLIEAVGQRRTVVYRSADGQSWSQAAVLEGADPALTAGPDGTFVLALSGLSNRLLRSADGRTWTAFADVPARASFAAPGLGVDASGDVLLASLVPGPGETHATCVDRVSRGRLAPSGGLLLSAPTALAAPGRNSYYVRPDAAGALVLHLRGSSTSPLRTDLLATRVPPPSAERHC